MCCDIQPCSVLPEAVQFLKAPPEPLASRDQPPEPEKPSQGKQTLNPKP